MKQWIKAVAIVAAVFLVLGAGFVGWLTLTEYRPKEKEPISVVRQTQAPALDGGAALHLLSWNIGYCGLGANESFVLDGGTGSGTPAQQSTVQAYYAGVRDLLAAQNADVCLLQEVDANSTRSYRLKETAALQQDLGVACSAYALNYSCPFVPYPWPPIGTVNSGVFTLTPYEIESAERISLPCPFRWPLRTANLKRCLLVSRMPLEGSEKELVVVNLHLEAYDEGEGKAAQTAMLLELLTQEYKAGNYVIAGGDFNQTFSGALDAWPVLQADLWAPNVLEASDLPEGWRFAYDLTVPSCRLLNQAYTSGDPSAQLYVLDGFILSPNVQLLNLETLDAEFANSDHNPVSLTVQLTA